MYQLRTTSSSPDLLAAMRRQLPYDPTEHSYGNVGDSSRWWYLPGMYQPLMHCRRCSKPPILATGAAPGNMMLVQMQKRKAKYEAAAQKSKDGLAGRDALTSGSLYRVPYVGRIPCIAEECITWPRYDAGVFSLSAVYGESMLELKEKEQRSLQIVCLSCNVVKQKQTGSSFSWKK